MKKLFKFSARLLIFLLILTNVPVVMADSAVTAMPVVGQMTNPHFADADIPFSSTVVAPTYYSSVGKTPAGAVYSTDEENVAAAIREGLESRTETITIYYSVGYAFPEDGTEANNEAVAVATKLFDIAIEETDQPTEGDSLRYCYSKWTLGGQFEVFSDHTDLTLIYTVNYFTTKSQEDELTAAVDELIDSFGFDADTTERQKVDTIYDWICDNVIYDYDNLEDDSHLLKYTAYAAMINKTAVCEGYAVLFYRLAEEVGLDARVITGYGDSERDVRHGWNIVRIGDYYFYLDSTWDAGKTNYEYYLKGENDFIGHVNDDEFNSVEFRDRYPIATNGLTELVSSGPYTAGDWKFTLYGDQAVIIEYLGNDTEITVPGAFQLGEYVIPVYAVDSGVFAYNSTVTSISISEGVYKLASGAIELCNNLVSVHLPASLNMQSYGRSSFTEAPLDCANISTVTVASGNPYITLVDGVLYTADMETLLYCPPANGKTELVVPDNVKVIGNSALADHATLQKITLPDSVIGIGYWAFTTSTKLEEVNIPKNCVWIGQYSFSNTAVTELSIPATTVDIIPGALSECYLETITVDSANTVYRMENGMLIGDGSVHKYALGSDLKACTVPNDVTKIHQNAFQNADILESVILPSTLDEIDQLAFEDCDNLRHISVPTGTTKIGALAFSGCDMLVSIIIPESVSTIEDSLHHPDNTVTVYGALESTAAEYALAEGLAFKSLGQFQCADGHDLQKTITDAPNELTESYQYICSKCGDHSKMFTTLYESMLESNITYELEYDSAIYDGSEHKPEVLWVKQGDTLLQENVHYTVLYGENIYPGGVNAVYLQGIGNFKGLKYIYFPIQKVSIENAEVEVLTKEFEYDGDPKQPLVKVVVNGKTLTLWEDYVISFSNNVEIGTGYVIVSGNKYYTGTVYAPFEIVAHEHYFDSDWSNYNDKQHYKFCVGCTNYVYEDHSFEDDCDTVCDVCDGTRTVSHKFTDKYDFNEFSHWLVCDDCGEMKVDSITDHNGGTATCTQKAKCADCKEEYGDIALHEWLWTDDGTNHWEYCDNCTATQSYGEHRGGMATCTEQGVCVTCNIAYGSLELHSWSWTDDGTNHWKYCDNCTATQSFSEHIGGTATCTEQGVCVTCNIAYGSLKQHSWTWTDDGTNHWEYCDNCTATQSYGEHRGGTSTCTDKATCEICSKGYGDEPQHNWNDEWDYIDDSGHAYGCTNCTEHDTIVPHTPGAEATVSSPQVCTECGYVINKKLVNPFTDVKTTDFFFAPVLWAVEKGVTTGVDADSFGPKQFCTRAQVVTFLWRAAGSPEPQNTINPFVDVKQSQYFYKAVLWAVEKGITTGIDPTHFGPSNTCTRNQTVTFLYRFAGKPASLGNNPFVDVKNTQYYYNAVLWAVENGITTGTDATHFAPNNTCTRGQVVTFLYRYAA